MSAHHSTRMCSPFKTVFEKIGDTYQAYCNTYKTHAMATLHRCSGCPLDKDTDLNLETADTEIGSTDGFNATVA